MNAMEQPAVYPKSDLENSERNGVFSNGVCTIVQVDNWLSGTQNQPKIWSEAAMLNIYDLAFSKNNFFVKLLPLIWNPFLLDTTATRNPAFRHTFGTSIELSITFAV